MILQDLERREAARKAKEEAAQAEKAKEQTAEQPGKEAEGK